MTQSNKTSKINVKLLAAIVIIIVLVSLTAVASQYMLTQPSEQPNTQLPDFTLLLIGANGQQKNLTKADLLALEAYSGRGGIKSHGNQISGVGNYTGVPISVLVELVGGMSSTQTLTAKASDNYTMTYSYNQVINGQDFSTYDAVTGSQTTATQPVMLVLTYYRDGSTLSSEEGPLRIGVLGNEGFITQGNIWAKMVIQLKVNPSAEPTVTPSPTPKPTTKPTTNPTTSPTTSPTATPTPTITLPATQVTIIGADGTTTVTLNETQLAAYTQTSGLGGKFKSIKGTFDYGTYAGVSITTLLDLVGGMSSSQKIVVTASDNWIQNYTYTEVPCTGLTLYDPATNATVTQTQPVTMILAYYLNGTATNLPYNDNAYLMTAFVGSEGYATTANLFTKYVTTLQII